MSDRKDITRLYGELSALRVLTQMLFTSGFMNNPNPLRACDETAQNILERVVHPTTQGDPAEVEPTLQSVKQSLEQFFRETRAYVADEMAQRSAGPSTRQ